MRRRHIHARKDEWIVVHRDRRHSNDSGAGCGFIIAIIFIVILLQSC